MKKITGNLTFRIALCLLCGLICGMPAAAYAQQDSQAAGIQVSGHVRDSRGNAIAGVGVTILNTQRGMITDHNGYYMITGVPSDGTLMFSFLGMTTLKIDVKGRSVVDAILEESSVMVDEVVVTAYATQKRVNVTGAISQLSGTDIVSTPVSNVSNALVGNAPGVSGLQTSGEPGRNSASIRIRGTSTFGNSTPLVVIDGVEQNSEQAFNQLDAMDPNEILGISILKDASSTAVYGIKGANGVIIVTTKRGSESKPVISYSFNYGITKAANMQKGLSSYDWASMRNEAVRHEIDSYGELSLANYLYSDTDLWKMKNNRDYTAAEVDAMTLTAAQKAALKKSPALYYGSLDTYKDQFGHYGPQMQHNLSIAGGTPTLKYFASLGYFEQEGITRNDSYYGAKTGSGYNRYNYRANFDVTPLRNLKISLNLSGQFGKSYGPGNTDDPFDLSARYTQIMQFIYESNPLMNPGIIDGHLVSKFAGENGSDQNPLGNKTGDQVGGINAVYTLLKSGSGEIYNTLFDNTIRIEHEMDYLTKGLTVHASVNFQDSYNRVVTRNPSIPEYRVQRSITDPNILEFFGGERWSEGYNDWGTRNRTQMYFDAGINWAGTFGDHNISALALGKGNKYWLPWDVNNSNTPSAMLGLVGRVTYDYASRYLFEVNIGYNGTEQFAEGKRYGVFPAFSVGWVPTNEKFFPENEWLTFMKIRASYGEVGNDQLLINGYDIRRYIYLPNTYLTGQGGYWWGNNGHTPGDYYSGVREGELGNPDVTWERAKKYNLGFEFGLFRDRLTITADLFKENRSNILTMIAVTPGIYGVPSDRVPPANVGKTTNKGYEIVAAWKDRVGNFSYSIEGHVSYAKNKIIYKAEPNNPYPWMNETGHSIGQVFGFRSNGLYNSLEELAARPYLVNTSNAATLGDVRYLDLNGDGIIDDNDKAPIGYPNQPEYHFGLKLGFAWKGIDVKMLFNGTAHGSFYVHHNMANAYFKRASNAWQWQYDGRWTADKAASGAEITYPRPTFDASISHNNYLTSDYWIRSNDFFKLKNVEIGYTLPSNLRFMRAARISSLRIYLSGNNLITFVNHMRKMGIDPETTDPGINSRGTAYIYPLTRVFNIGFNIQF